MPQDSSYRISKPKSLAYKLLFVKDIFCLQRALTPYSACVHVGWRFGCPAETRPIHSTVDNSGETGQTVFRLHWDTNFPVSLNQVCCVGCTQPKEAIPCMEFSVISLETETHDLIPHMEDRCERTLRKVKRGFVAPVHWGNKSAVRNTLNP